MPPAPTRALPSRQVILAPTIGPAEPPGGAGVSGGPTRWRPEVALVAAGLFLASSDRFLAVDFGTLTLKPSFVFFGLAAALVGARGVVRAAPEVRGVVPGLVPVLAGLVTIYLVATATAMSPPIAITQMVVIIGGALVPLVAVGFGPATRPDVDRAVTALFAGTLAAATFGFYQYLAPLLGWPIPAGFAYTGAVAGLGRISAWSYEPAFYVFHVELTLAIAIGDVLARRRRFKVRPEIPAAYLLASLVLANARIGFLSLPVLVLLVLLVSSRNRGFDRRAVRFLRLAVAAGVAAVLIGVPLGVNLPGYVAERVISVTNTQEAESNAIRVSLYGTELELARARPLLGYGPSNIGLELTKRIPAYAGVPPQSAPANNLVLQAVLDAGVAAMALTLAFVVVVLRTALRSPSRDTRLLFAGATAILLINAMTASLFWDLRLWAVLGLGYAAARTHRLDRRVTEVPARPS